MPQSRQAQIANLDDARRGHEDIGRFEIAVKDKVRVEIVQAAEELMQQSAERRRGDRRADSGGVVVNDLLCVSVGLLRRSVRDGVPGNRARHTRRPCRLPCPLG
jgi:hypothetical protein